MRDFTFLLITVNASCSFKPCLDDLRTKATRAIFALNKRYKFQKLLVNMAQKRFDSLILPILLCGSEVWNHIGGITFSLGIKPKLKEFIYSFLKGFLEFVNITTRNIVVRAELRRYLLTLTLKQ